METLKEFVSSKKLFYELNSIKELDFLQNVDPETIDLLYIFRYGNRRLSESTKRDYDNVLLSISMMYTKKWNDLYKLFLKDIPLDYNYKVKTTETIKDVGKVDSDNNTTVTDTNKKDVSAYNEDDFVPLDKDERIETTTGGNKQTSNNDRVRELTTEGNNSNILYDYEKYLVYLEEKFLLDIVFNDINKMITINVF